MAQAEGGARRVESKPCAPARRRHRRRGTRASCGWRRRPVRRGALAARPGPSFRSKSFGRESGGGGGRAGRNVWLNPGAPQASAADLAPPRAHASPQGACRVEARARDQQCPVGGCRVERARTDQQLLPRRARGRDGAVMGECPLAPGYSVDPSARRRARFRRSNLLPTSLHPAPTLRRRGRAASKPARAISNAL